MNIDDVQRGQRGTCLTVFEGTEVEEVPFFVKGVMKDYLGPERDLVMIRLEGDKAEFTGVVAGMSGSPCSIDGKLVGALGYAFAAFAKSQSQVSHRSRTCSIQQLYRIQAVSGALR